MDCMKPTIVDYKSRQNNNFKVRSQVNVNINLVAHYNPTQINVKQVTTQKDEQGGRRNPIHKIGRYGRVIVVNLFHSVH